MFTRLLAAVTEPGQGHPILPTTAAWFGPLDHPAGLIATPWVLAERLDGVGVGVGVGVGGGDGEDDDGYRTDADTFEAEAYASSPLDVSRAWPRR